MRRKLNLGFTLLEAMVAVAILLIAICSLLAALVNCLLLNESNNHLVTAFNDAQYVLEQIKQEAFDNIDSYTSPELSNLNNEDIPQPDVTDITSNLKEVTVDVNWSERGNPKNISLSTRIAR